MEQKRNRLALQIKQEQTVYNAQLHQLVMATYLAPQALLSRVEVLHKEYTEKVRKLILKGA